MQKDVVNPSTVMNDKFTGTSRNAQLAYLEAMVEDLIGNGILRYTADDIDQLKQDIRGIV